MMQTAKQISQDIKAFWKHLEKLEKQDSKRVVATTEAQHKLIFNQPKPFEFAKLEQWKPSKHAKR